VPACAFWGHIFFAVFFLKPGEKPFTFVQTLQGSARNADLQAFDTEKATYFEYGTCEKIFHSPVKEL